MEREKRGERERRERRTGEWRNRVKSPSGVGSLEGDVGAVTHAINCVLCVGHSVDVCNGCQSVGGNHLEHLHRAGLFAIFGHITNTRVIFWLALPIQRLSGDELLEGAPTAQIYYIC
jgi:hypothetical protein